MPKPTLNELAAFAAVAEQRNFRKAANTLGISRSALSHAMRGLEQDLGIRLLNRTTRSVSLTEAGARLLADIKPVLHDLDVALDALADVRGAPSGTLRINANKGAVRLLLRQAVPTFLSRFPDVALELVSDDRLIDIVAAGFDAGIRLAEDVPQDMIAVNVGGDVRFIAVASPDYLAHHPTPVVPDDLRHHQCIRHRFPSGRIYRWEFARHGKEIVVDAPGTLTLDDNHLMMQAALQGLGIAYLPEAFAHGALDDGRLVQVLADWCPSIPGLKLYYPGSRNLPSALRAFIDVLKQFPETGKLV